ncbi:MAG: hypothetical protein NVS2B12_29370 [Ktedonobacteraceae bacterium]
MLCPVCQQEMTNYKEEPCYSRNRQVEYKRTYYRCRKDDTWGRIEVPIVPYTVEKEDEAMPS